MSDNIISVQYAGGKEKLKGLDVVRAFACVAIFTFHTFLTLLGSFAVSVFFVLSGFLMAYNYYGKEGLDTRGLKACVSFSLKRIKKLYPLHVITTLVMLAFTLLVRWAGMGAEERRVLLGSLAASLALVQSWVPNIGVVTGLNGVSWYLSDILFIYMCFPPLLHMIRGYKSRKSAWVSIGLIGLIMLVSAPAFVAVYDALTVPGAAAAKELDVYFCYHLPLYRLGDFAIGCNLGWLFLTRENKDMGRGKATALELLAIAAAIAAQSIFGKDILPEELKRCALFLLPSGLLVYVFALGQGYISRLLDCRPVHFIAALSTEIFLIHQVVIKLGTFVINSLPLPLWLMKWGGFAGIAVMSVLLSWLYSRYFGTGRAKNKKSG